MEKPIILTEKEIRRFWTRVDVRGENECWEWKAGKFDNGYGSFGTKRGTYRAHRVAWQIANRRPPREGYSIAHAPVICHNRACCNPAHLSEKTLTENMADKKLDGTLQCGKRNGRYTKPESTARGEKNAAAKITTSDAPKIKELRKQGVIARIVANMFGLGISQVYRIEKGESWQNDTV